MNVTPPPGDDVGETLAWVIEDPTLDGDDTEEMLGLDQEMILNGFEEALMLSAFLPPEHVPH